MTARPSTIPLYSLTDVSRYAHAQAQLVRRLYLGYRDDDRERPPLLRSSADAREPAPLSFDDLIETAVVAALRARGMSLQSIRTAYRAAAAEEADHPFARRDIMVSGNEIFMRTSEGPDEGSEQLASLMREGQRALRKVLGEYVQRIDWQDKWPVEWRPKGGVVRQNPEIDFGLPQVHGIRTEIIRGRFEAEEPIGAIADDFGLTVDDVESALRYELWLKAA